MDRTSLTSQTLDRRTRILTYASEALIATVASLAAAFVAASSVPTDGDANPLIRFVFVFAVVLASLIVYRWSWERRLTRNARAFVAESEKKVADVKDQFIANVSHGLKTPLTGIVGFSHILHDDLEDPDNKEAVEMILGESAEMSRIVDDLLTTARIDADVLDITREEVAFSDQIAEIVDFMELFNARIDLSFQDAAINVDPERFRHVLRNVVVNAHRHGMPTVSVTGSVRNGRYICDVIDRGAGVPTNVQDHLFTRFTSRSTEQVSGHVGLGLSVAKELCDRMDIQISYRRYRGETHFVLSIPLASPYPITELVQAPASGLRQFLRPAKATTLHSA